MGWGSGLNIKETVNEPPASISPSASWLWTLYDQLHQVPATVPSQTQ